MGEEPVRNDAMAFSKVDDAVDACGRIKIYGEKQPDPPDFFDLRVLQKFFNQFSLCLNLIQKFFIFDHLQRGQGGSAANWISAKSGDMTQLRTMTQ